MSLVESRSFIRLWVSLDGCFYCFCPSSLHIRDISTKYVCFCCPSYGQLCWNLKSFNLGESIFSYLMAEPFMEEDKQKADLFSEAWLILSDDLFVLVIFLPSFSFSAQTPKKSEHFPLQIPSINHHILTQGQACQWNESKACDLLGFQWARLDFLCRKPTVTLQHCQPKQGLTGPACARLDTQLRREGGEMEREREIVKGAERGVAWAESDRPMGGGQRDSEHRRQIERVLRGASAVSLQSWRWMCKDGPSLSSCQCRLCPELLSVSVCR